MSAAALLMAALTTASFVTRAMSSEPCPGSPTTVRPIASSPIASPDTAVASPDPAATRNAPHGRPGIEPPTPEAWAARILTMRASGHDDAADRELEALRLRYPGFAIPANASRSTEPH